MRAIGFYTDEKKRKRPIVLAQVRKHVSRRATMSVAERNRLIRKVAKFAVPDAYSVSVLEGPSETTYVIAKVRNKPHSGKCDELKCRRCILERRRIRKRIKANIKKSGLERHIPKTRALYPYGRSKTVRNYKVVVRFVPHIVEARRAGRKVSVEELLRVG